MCILKNALAAIQVGIEDYRSNGQIAQTALDVRRTRGHFRAGMRRS